MIPRHHRVTEGPNAVDMMMNALAALVLITALAAPKIDAEQTAAMVEESTLVRQAIAEADQELSALRAWIRVRPLAPDPRLVRIRLIDPPNAQVLDVLRNRVTSRSQMPRVEVVWRERTVIAVPAYDDLAQWRKTFEKALSSPTEGEPWVSETAATADLEICVSNAPQPKLSGRRTLRIRTSDSLPTKEELEPSTPSELLWIY